MKTAGCRLVRLIRAGGKGKQVQVLYELVTVSREYQKEKSHWITGRQASDVWICESGDLPVAYMEVNPDHE